MKVVPGNSSPLLAKKIANITNAKLINVTFKRFPDGELYVRIEGVEKDDEVVLVQSITTNDDLIYLLLMLDALEDANVTAVIPYMGYARQDRKFMEGEAISIRAIARLIESYVEKVITVNIHSKLSASYFRKLIEVDAMPLIGKYYQDKDIIMISPDVGSLERVKVAAKYAGCEFDYIEKVRIDAERVEMKPKSLNVKGKDIVIIDDIISTGGTVIEAAKMLFKEGAKSVECACVHAVLAGNALNKIYAAGIRNVISTDTIERAVSVISVAEEIAKVLKS